MDPVNNTYIEGCGYKNPKIKRKLLEIVATYSQDEDQCVQDTVRKISAADALAILEGINEENCHILGFNSARGRPDWMIIKNLPVAPPPVRPSVEMMNNMRAEDDLTS